MPSRIDDFDIGQCLITGIESVDAAGKDDNIQPMPTQFKRLHEPGRSCADDDCRNGSGGKRCSICEDHVKPSFGAYSDLSPRSGDVLARPRTVAPNPQLPICRKWRWWPVWTAE